jgi:predicted Zn-dependent peptidase
MSMAETELQIGRVDLHGVPVYWAEAPEPTRAALLFRVGRADESMATAGLSHLVEHLALFGSSSDPEKSNGFVDSLRTVFFTSGTAAEVSDFLHRLSTGLSSLPLERVEVEKRVLLTEAISHPSGSPAGLMGLRFGAQRFGLVDYEELGLRRAGVDEILDWARERFVAENAAAWIVGPQPERLVLDLPHAHRAPLPSRAPRAGVAFPAYLPTAAGNHGVAASFVGPRSVALSAALSLIQQRLHENLRLRRGLSYSALATYQPLSAESAHLTIGADCLDEHAIAVRDQLLEELKRLADQAPESSELARLTEAFVSSRSSDPSTLVSEIDTAAFNELLGMPNQSRRQLQREYEELVPEAVAGVVREMLPTTILSAPTGAHVPAGFNRFADVTSPPVDGHRYLRRGKRSHDLPQRSNVVVSMEGVSVLREPPAGPITVRFADTVAVLELGPGRMTIVGASGDFIRLDFNALIKGDEIEQRVRQQVPEHLFVPFESQGAGALIDLARQKLGYRTRVAKELGLLPERLQPGERPLTLAVAVYRQRRGLLALTDRRLLHLSKASTKKPKILELQLSDVSRVRRGRFDFLERRIKVTAAGKTHTFAELRPTERLPEFLEGLASPDNPTFTDQPVDTSLRGRVIAYGAGAVVLLFGLPVLAGHTWSAIPFAFGCSFLVRSYRRRRAHRQKTLTSPDY